MLEILSSNCSSKSIHAENGFSHSDFENSSYQYKFSFNNLEDLNCFLNQVKDDNDVKDVQITRLT